MCASLCRWAAEVADKAQLEAAEAEIATLEAQIALDDELIHQVLARNDDASHDKDEVNLDELSDASNQAINLAWADEFWVAQKFEEPVVPAELIGIGPAVCSLPVSPMPSMPVSPMPSTALPAEPIAHEPAAPIDIKRAGASAVAGTSGIKSSCTTPKISKSIGRRLSRQSSLKLLLSSVQAMRHETKAMRTGLSSDACDNPESRANTTDPLVALASDVACANKENCQPLLRESAKASTEPCVDATGPPRRVAGLVGALRDVGGGRKRAALQLVQYTARRAVDGPHGLCSI